MAKKKVNPYRRPATVGDVKAAYRKGITHGIEGAFALFFTVMLDKEGYEQDDLIRVWQHIESMSTDVANGDLDIETLYSVLDEEAGICFAESETAKAAGWKDWKDWKD